MNWENWRTKKYKMRIKRKKKNTTNEDKVLCWTKEVSILFRSYAFHSTKTNERVCGLSSNVCFVCIQFLVFFFSSHCSFVRSLVGWLCVANATSCKGIHAGCPMRLPLDSFYTVKCTVTILSFTVPMASHIMSMLQGFAIRAASIENARSCFWNWKCIVSMRRERFVHMLWTVDLIFINLLFHIDWNVPIGIDSMPSNRQKRKLFSLFGLFLGGSVINGAIHIPCLLPIQWFSAVYWPRGNGNLISKRNERILIQNVTTENVCRTYGDGHEYLR